MSHQSQKGRTRARAEGLAYSSPGARWIRAASRRPNSAGSLQIERYNIQEPPAPLPVPYRGTGGRTSRDLVV